MGRKTIELRSDNTTGAAPEILEAIVSANSASAAPYGDDPWTHRIRLQVRREFDHPEAEVFPVVSGTAGNALGLSALCPPWGSVLCHETAHVLRSECGATSLFAGGAILRGVPGPEYKIDVRGLRAMLDSTRWGDPHESQPAVLSLTLATDFGTVYSPREIGSLARLAREKGMRVHIDGARIANAIAYLRCSPADLTWRAGADIITLGATKNGAMNTDAIVSFDPRISRQLAYRLKRAGHVPSKMRFHAAQLEAYLSGGLWLKLAERANSALRLLHAGLIARQIEVLNAPEANIAFLRLPSRVADQLSGAGLMFYRIGPETVRMVTSFQTTSEEILEVLSRLDSILAKAGWTATTESDSPRQMSELFNPPRPD